MKLESIAFNNLRRRKSRMAFLVLGLLIGVATVVTLISLSAALTDDVQHKMENYGANILITPRSDDLSLSYGGITLGGVSVNTEEIRQADLSRIKTIPNSRNIAAIAPKVLGAVQVGNERILLMGVDVGVEFHLKRWWSISGTAVVEDHQLVVGHVVATRLGLEPGSTLEISGETLLSAASWTIQVLKTISCSLVHCRWSNGCWVRKVLPHWLKSRPSVPIAR